MVRVLWLVFVFIPVIPLGSYRYQDMSSGIFDRRFVAKQTQMRWSMVFTHWFLVVAVVAVLVLMRYQL